MMRRRPGRGLGLNTASKMKPNRFPIMLMADPWNKLPTQMNSIPWELIAPHEQQALRNHSQSLEKLTSRGGLSPCEAVAVLEDADYRTRWPNQILSPEQMIQHNTEAINRLSELCSPDLAPIP